jgi:BMFP domain-containing protein YqiC
MQSQNKMFEDLAKVLNGAAGTLAGMAREAQDTARDRAREFVGGMDFVSREEFETLKDRLAAVEAELATLKEDKPAAAKKAPAKPKS